MPVEVPEESRQVKNRRKKALAEEKAASRASKRKKQSLAKLFGIFAVVASLVGITLAAQMIPAFRETLSKVMLAGGIVCFVIAWFGTLSVEDEPMMRMLIRYFPPAIFITLLMRLDEAWPFMLLAAGGAIVAVLGLTLGAA